MPRISITVLACLLTCSSAHSWGPEGHKIVARIAEQRLDKNALLAVEEILGPDRHLADISTLSDELRNQESAPWHYVNVPIDVRVFDRARYCPDNQCVVGAVERFRDELKKAGLSPQARYEALYNLVHFVGDLHQPLHCGDRGDRGGNEVKVNFFGSETNLHRVWDSGIIDQMKLGPEILFRRVSQIATGKRRAWSAGSPEGWAIESHDLARDVVYRFKKPASGEVVLGRGYQQRAAPRVTGQLARAGIRLAFVLNQVFAEAPAATPVASEKAQRHRPAAIALSRTAQWSADCSGHFLQLDRY